MKVFVAAMALMFGGCITDEEVRNDDQPPRSGFFAYYLSDTWSRPEAKAIHEAAEVWESLSCLRLFEYRGMEPHDGGWREEKVNDGKNVVYPFSRIDTTPDIVNLVGASNGYYANDILVRRFVWLRAVDSQICFYDRDSNLLRCSSEEEALEDPVFLYHLAKVKMVAIHEFGHALGLGHNDREPSVMGTDAAPAEFWSDVPTETDIDNLCRIYSCPADCPTRP